MAKSDNNRTACCSFCGASQESVRKLIAGNGVYICDDCVRLCMDIVQMDEHEESVKRTKILLGDGDVPFPAYLKALEEIGYKGFLTIEREVGDNPTADIEKAVRFLRGLM